MTSKSSSSNAVDAISALVNIWGYSNSCKLILNKNGDKEWTSLYSDLDNGYVFKYDGGQEAYMVDDITMWYSLYDELDNERPVIIGGGNHAYVCDGFDNEYIHYNFGWDGIYNGYYRTIILPEIEVKGSSHIKYCIIGITPPDLTPLTD